jgi:hypothetical protein
MAAGVLVISLSACLPPIASQTTLLSATGFSALAVDDTAQHVYVSSAESGVITVLDFTGTVIQTIAEPGAGRMIVHDGTLFVGLASGTVDRFDSTTLQPLGPLVTGLPPVLDLAFAAGRLWVVSGTCWAASPAEMNAIDPVTGQADSVDLQGMNGCLELFSGDARPNLLFITDSSTTPSFLVRWDVSTAPPTSTTAAWGAFAQYVDASMSSDGSLLYVAGTFNDPSGGGDYAVRAFSTDDLSLAPAPIIIVGGYPDAVAYTPGHGGRLGVSQATKALHAYDAAAPNTELFHQPYQSIDDDLFRRAVAWSGDGTRLIAVTGETYTFNPILVRVHFFDV